MHAAQALCLPPVLSSPRSATKKPKVVVDDITLARAIAKSREALFSCLQRDLPDSGSELSLTDLVEEYESAACSPAPAVKNNVEVKGGCRGDQHGAASTKGREKKRLRRSSSSSSSGRGILLNVYVPTTLTQSPGRRSRGSDHGREKKGHGRDLEPSFGGCWSVLIGKFDGPKRL